MDGVLAVARPSVLIPTRVASATSVTTGWPTNAASTPTRRQADVSHGKRHKRGPIPHPPSAQTSLAVAPRPPRGRHVLRGERRAKSVDLASPVADDASDESPREPLGVDGDENVRLELAQRLVASFSLRRSRGNRDAISHAPIAERSSIGKSDEGRPAAIVAGPPTPATARAGSPRAAASVRSAARNPPARTSPEGSPARIHTRSVRRETKSDEHVNGNEDEGS